MTTEVNPDAAQISPLALSDMRIIGEAQQQWAPLRRKYNLFLYRPIPGSESRAEAPQLPANQPLSNSQALDLTSYNQEGEFGQFAHVDEPFLSWDFSLLSADGRLIGSVNRNFSGFGREILTDTGVYALRMDAAGLAQEPRHLISKTGQQEQDEQARNVAMTLDQRAVMLATAVSVDFDYFSRHSGSGGGFMPLWFPGMGGGAAEAGAGAEAGAEAGAIEEAGGATKGMTRGGAGSMEEGAITGAGTMAGYEAMQRGRGGGNVPPQEDQLPGQVGQDEDVWGKGDDPWNNDGGDGGGDGWGWGDFFGE